MLDIRWNAFWLGLSLAGLCLIVWMNEGIVPALCLLSAGLFSYLLFNLYWLHQLQSWLKKANPNDVPHGNGVWRGVFTALFKNQRKQARTEQNLIASLEGFKRATSALPDGIVILNHRNEIEWCNPPAEAQLGLNLSQDVNQAIHNLVRYSEFIEYLQAEHYNDPLQLKSRRNSDITMLLQLIPFGAEQKLLICRDVSAQEKTDNMRRDFIANVSHELRTPLTVVGGFLETLYDTKGVVSKEVKSYFDMMIDQTRRMRRIIEDLLTLSTLESNNDAPQDKVIQMQSLLKMIQNDAKGLSSGKHKIYLEADKNLNISGSQEELLSAFSNLVSNAIRYTPEGGKIYICWRLNDNSQPVFSVRDTGIGIEQKHIDRLTERFYRVDRSRSRDTGGTGLGLAIVKHILQRHNAKLSITSEFGKGSTFSIILPQARAVIKNIGGKPTSQTSAEIIAETITQP